MTLTWTAEDGAGDLAHRTAATLPEWYGPAGDTNLTVLDGGAGWPAALARAVTAGATDVLLVAPRPVDPDEVPGGPERLTLAEPFSGTPGLATAVDYLRDQLDAAGSVLVTGYESTDDVATALLHAVRLLRGTGVRELTAHAARRTAGSLLVDATGLLAGRRIPIGVTIALTDAVPPRFVLQFFAVDAVAEIVVPDGSSAHPVAATVTSPAGAHTLPTHYESADRAAWRSAHTAHTDGLTTPAVLSDLVADLRTVAATLA